MRKNADLLAMTAWVIVILVSCALLMNSLEPLHRVALLVTAAATGWVFLCCESRVQRAHAPLILRDESVAEKTKLPEGGNE